MATRVTSPKRKKMTTKARIKPGSKEAKEWNLRMQEIKKKRREERKREEEKKKRREKKKSSKTPRGNKKMTNSHMSPKKNKKRMENVPFSQGTLVSPSKN